MDHRAKASVFAELEVGRECSSSSWNETLGLGLDLEVKLSLLPLLASIPTALVDLKEPSAAGNAWDVDAGLAVVSAPDKLEFTSLTTDDDESSLLTSLFEYAVFVKRRRVFMSHLEAVFRLVDASGGTIFGRIADVEDRALLAVANRHSKQIRMSSGYSYCKSCSYDVI